jgi:hypothetical protein
MSPQTLLNPSFENWAAEPGEGGFAPASWTRVIAGVANLVANGDFATNDLTSWTAAAGWDATTGKAVHTAGIADVTPLAQNISLTDTRTYELTFRITGWTAGTISIDCENVDEGAHQLSNHCDYSYRRVWTATATDATSLMTFTPSAAFDGAIEDISVRDLTLSNVAICADRSHLDAYPSLFGIDMAIDATPNVATVQAVLTLVASEDYHLYFKHQWSHDDPAIVAPDAHFATVTVKTHDSSLYLQADLTWGAGAYSFPIASKAAMERFSKRFTADAGDTSYLLIFSSNDLHGSAGYHVHQYIDNVHCEVDMSDLGVVV